MQLVPDHHPEETKDMSDHTRDHDDNNSSHRIEWLNEIHWRAQPRETTADASPPVNEPTTSLPYWD
jgi:hypothetical protein